MQVKYNESLILLMYFNYYRSRAYKALFISYKQNEIFILNILTLLTIKSKISEEVKKLINIHI